MQLCIITEKCCKIKHCAKDKEKHRNLYREMLDRDLIAAEFKCHEEYRRNLTRSTKENYLNKKGNSSDNFTNVANYIHKYLSLMPQAVGLNALMEIYFDNVSD